MGLQTTGALFGMGFLLIRFGLMLAMVAWCVLVIVAVWRAMKAHESIADSLRRIAERQP